MSVGEETEELSKGDVVFIPKGETHQFTNLLPDEPLVFISIFWDSPEARERMNALVNEGAEER